MLKAGKLRHRVTIQKPVDVQDDDTGAVERSWVNVATVWSAIEPLSVKELIAAQSEDSKVSARITMRYRSDISHEMRLYHESKDKYYNIEGILADKNSGLEYITIPTSEGVRYQEGAGVIPDLLAEPEISGTPEVGETLTGSTGVWANDPTGYTYQWYLDDVAITGQTDLTITVPDEAGSILSFGVIASNNAGDGDEAVSTGVLITA